MKIEKTPRERVMFIFLVMMITTIGSFLSACKKDAMVEPAQTVKINNNFSDMSLAATTAAPSGITHDIWLNVKGNDVSNIPLTTTPSSSSRLTRLELTNSTAANIANRIRGYITAPITGNYTFWIAGDDAAELWLSTDATPDKAVKIASFLSWTSFREWNKFSSQRSAAVTLAAGTKYYIEVRHKQGAGDGSVSVQWQLPNGAMESPIASNRLTPYVQTATTAKAITSSGKYTASGVINLTNQHDITISGKSIAGGNVPCITLTNCYNIHITGCKLYNSTDVGIHMYKCANVTVDNSYFTNVASGVYAEQTSNGGIVVNSNQFYNMVGPYPRGQFVQFNNVNGSGSAVTNNKGENIFGQSHAEDAISMYQSNGTPSSPIMISGNWIRGGGPSSSGGGIMLGDEGGSYLTAQNNILVNPGEYGMAIAGGDHNSIINNTIYGIQQSFTNVGLYVNSINGYTVTNSTVSGNKVLFFNSSNYPNPCWLAPGTNKPSGWDTANTWGANNLSASVLPGVIITENQDSQGN